MRTPVALMLMAVVTSPFVIETAPVRRDSSLTTVAVGVGSGSFADVTRGCSGEVLRAEQDSFGDAGFVVEHDPLGPGLFGVRASRVTGDDISGQDGLWFWNPYFAVETQDFGFGVGAVAGDRDQQVLSVPPASGHLRAGNLRDGLAVFLSVGEALPLISDGGLYSLGFVMPEFGSVQFRLSAVAGAPYDAFGGHLSVRARLGGGMAAMGGFRLGSSAGVSENAFSLGLAWSAVHQRTATPISAAEAAEDSLRALKPKTDLR